MSQPEDPTTVVDETQFSEEESPELAPALGVIATDDTSVLENILNAREYGLDVIVVTPTGDKTTATVAQKLGCDVVTTPLEDPTTEDLRQQLILRASATDKPGIILPREPTDSIDIEQSVDAFDPEDEVTEAVTREEAQDLEILVGIPAYNEESTIVDVVSEASAYGGEVLVVDDGSQDETVERARQAGATVVEHDENKGYGAALQTVFQEAHRRRANYLAIIDGDGQHDPSDIPRAVETQDDTTADIIIGSRFATGSETEIPLYRRVGLGVINVLTNLSMGVLRPNSWVRDTQSGFRTYNRAAIQSLAEDDTLGDGMNASTDILYHAHQHGYELEEIGTTITYDVENASSHNPVSHGLSLVSNILKTIEQERPILSLGLPGFVSAFAGLGFGYWTFHNYLVSGTFPIGTALTSAFFTLAGIFACFTAIILHSLSTHLDE